jgi:zinc protease
MKTKIFVAFLIIGLGGTVEMFAQSFDLTKNTRSFTAAGMPVILHETSAHEDVSSEIVAIEITAFGGVDLAPKAGVLALMTSLLYKGTASFSKERINEILIRTGASLNFDAGYDSLDIEIKTLKRFLPEVLELTAEMMSSATFEQSEIDLLKSQAAHALKTERQNPDSLLQLLMHQSFFRDHPYYRRPSGYEDSISEIGRSDIVTAARKAFSKSNLLFVIVGQLSQNESKKLIEDYFSKLQNGTRTPEVTEALRNQSRIEFQTFDAPTTYFLAKFRAPSLFHEDYPALAIGLQILDNRLFDEVRTKRGLTYAVRASLGNSRVNSGNLYVSSTKLEEAVKVMFEEVKKLQVELVSPELLDLQVRKFLSSWYAGRETRASQAAIFSLYEVFGMGWENSNGFIKRLEKVSPEDVQRVMRNYLKDVTVQILGRERVELQPILASMGFLPLQAPNSQ